MSTNRYVYGNTARDLRPVEKNIKPVKRLSNSARRNRERDLNMTFGFVAFLTAAMVVTCILCIKYIQLQSAMTEHVKTVSKMEVTLSQLKAENDDTESRIKDNVGLEEIKKRAMDELCMKYASEDQIVIYESDGTDYVRQLKSIE